YAPALSDHVFFFQAEDGIRVFHVTGVQTCALPISISLASRYWEIPSGCRNSSCNNSPGVTGFNSRIDTPATTHGYLVVIGNFNITGAGSRPTKTQSVLRVNTDAELTFTVAT